eukprot:gene6811-3665_t
MMYTYRAAPESAISGVYVDDGFENPKINHDLHAIGTHSGCCTHATTVVAFYPTENKNDHPTNQRKITIETVSRTDAADVPLEGHHWFDTKMWRNPQEPLPDAYRTEINLRISAGTKADRSPQACADAIEKAYEAACSDYISQIREHTDYHATFSNAVIWNAGSTWTDSDEAPTDGNELAGMCNFVESNGDAMLIIWTYTYSKVHVESFQGFEGGIIDMNSYDADENGDDMWDNDDHTVPIVATITGGIKLVQTTVMKPSVCTIM